MAVIEAALAGRPVVVSDVPGAAEVAEEAGSGILVPAGDVAALSRALAGLLADGPRADRLGALGREHALRRHTPEAVAARMRTVYGEALALQRTGGA
jgi:glycosyltransferase involved in cell wall biosynthesis